MASELDDGMLEPNNAYHSHYKEEFKHNAEDLFDELTRKSGVDVEANKATCRDIRKLDKDIEVDILIIGAGMTGMTLAYYLKDKDICVVDASLIGHGVTLNSTAKINYFQETQH